MSLRRCEAIAEKLIDYDDGGLPPDEELEVAQHLAECERCRAELASLRRSLAAAKAVWAEAEANLAGVSLPPVAQRRSRRLAKVMLAAACAVLVLAGPAIWLLHREASRPAEPTLAEIQMSVARASGAARLLASADALADEPSARDEARERYQYLISSFPEQPAAAAAASRLRELTVKIR